MMTFWFNGYLKLAVGGLLILGLCLADVEAQTKKKRSRRTRKPAVSKPVITNPDIVPPTTTDASGDVKIISTADQTDGAASSEAPQPKKPKATSSDDMKQTITTLSNQVNRLNDKLSQMQEDDRYQLDMERLTRAEQRAEQLRSQLIDTQSKIADLEARVDQVEYGLKPENIDRAIQGMGSVHPEEARESRRRQLENERSRLQAQLKILETSKNRLETSIVNADAEVDNLRAKLNARREQMDNAPAVSTPPKKP